MNKEIIPTAEELLRKYSESWGRIVEQFRQDDIGHPDPERILINASDAILLARKFAKLHVTTALKSVTEEDLKASEDDEDAILNAYPLENIK